MRVYICGGKLFGEAVFRLCTEMGFEIVGVSSPAFRSPHEKIRDYLGDGSMGFDRLRQVAANTGVPWLEAGLLREKTLPDAVDLIIAAHSFDLIGEATLLKARLGGIGYHPSLLPLHRGRDAVRWTIAMGDKVAGGTVYWLTAYVDCGPIAAQDWCFVRPDDTAETLWRRDLFRIGVRLFAKSLRDIATGRIVRVPQDKHVGSWEPSWDRPPLFRPDLLMLGSMEGFTVDVAEDSLHGYRG